MKKKSRARRLLQVFFLITVLGLGLFIANGTSESWRQPRLVQDGSHSSPERVETVKVLAFNIAKCFAWTGVRRFSSEGEVNERLERIAQLIEDSGADLVFLSEVVNECGLRPQDHVATLAEKGGFSHWATSDNYSFGVPFFRMRSGNAVLSRFPLSNGEVTQLHGGGTIWNPTNTRRVLWAKVAINGRDLQVASIRNDSFDIANNAVQASEILAQLAGKEALLAGDFNAEPDDKSMRLFRESGLFSGRFSGPATYPTRSPYRRIDYVLAPKSWTLVEERIIQSRVSDHLPVLATFRLPR